MMARNVKNISAMEVGINGRRNITSDFKPLFSRGSSKINQKKHARYSLHLKLEKFKCINIYLHKLIL